MPEIPAKELTELKRNIHIRKSAETAYELAVSLLHENCSNKGNDIDRFWHELSELVAKHLEKKQSKRISKHLSMSKEESNLFGNQLMPYGEYRDKRVDEVPLDRLRWYADQTFVDDLRMYLESERIKSETSIS